MNKTPRHGINLISERGGTAAASPIHMDALFEICDAEFNSRSDIHRAARWYRGAKSFARYYLTHEIKKIATRVSKEKGDIQFLYAGVDFPGLCIARHIASAYFPKAASCDTTVRRLVPLTRKNV